MPGVVPLTVNVFLAGFVWPLWVGQEKGFYVENGVDVRLVGTPNSIEQMGGLIDGRFDIAMTAIDNVVAYMEGQGEARTANEPDIVAVMGSSSGFLSLMAQPEIGSMADLKGKVLAVDAMTTGYSYTLRRMMKLSGFTEADYTLVAVGGMKERYAALLKGEQAGTLSVPPYTVQARDRGFNEIATALGMLGHFQGGVAAVRREWAAGHGAAIEGFIRGTIEALAWLYEPGNKPKALEIFQRHLPGTAEDAAEKSYAVLLDPVHGFPRDAAIDLAGVQTVIDIRTEFHRPYKKLGEPGRYCDLSFYERAVAR